ncbi:hypothetical protein KEM54_004130, partial [Ascosphaera aggregata]
RKARLHTVSERESEPLETLFRIKEVVREGLTLVVSKKVPIILVDRDNAATFLYRHDMPLPTSQATMPSAMASSRNHGRLTNSRSDQDSRTVASPANGDSSLNAGSASYALAMDRMVDSLVDSDVPHKPNPVFGAPDQLSGNQHLNRPRIGSLSAAGQTVQSPFPSVEPKFKSYSPPTLPSILNTPFAPQPSDAFLGTKDTAAPFGLPGQIYPSATYIHHPSLQMQFSRQGQFNPVDLSSNIGGQSYDLTPSAKVPRATVPSHSFNQTCPPAWSHFSSSLSNTNGENSWVSGRPGFGAVGSGRRQGD